MVRIFISDLKKIYGDKRIYLCTLSLAVICLLFYFESIREQTYYDDLANGFLVIMGSEVILFCFLICIVGGSFLFCIEEKYAYFMQMIQRVGVKRYVVGKLATATITGFLTAFSGLILTIISVSSFLFIAYRNTTFHVVNVTELTKILFEIILFSMLCGLLSAIGFLVTTFYTNYYIGMTAPILIYYALLTSYIWVPVPANLQISKVFLAVNTIEHKFLGKFLYAVLYLLFCLILMYWVTKKRVQRRVEHA